MGDKKTDPDALPGIARAVAVGSLGWRRETVGDLELLRVLRKPGQPGYLVEFNAQPLRLDLTDTASQGHSRMRAGQH